MDGRISDGALRSFLRRDAMMAAMPEWWNGRHRGLNQQLSPRGETRAVTPVKFGESPGPRGRANAEPSPRGKV